jgi:hypothetical protein
MKHTPGPWKIIAIDGCVSVYQKRIPDERIKMSYSYDVVPWIAEDIKNPADARLIAAAPELLEALEEIRNIEKSARNMEDDEIAPLLALERIRIKTRDAIAKATDEQS